MSSEYIEYNFNLEIKATCSKTCERCKMCKWLKLCDQGSQTIPHFHLCPFLLYRHLSHLYLFAFPCHLFQPCHLCRLYSSHFFHPSLCLVALPVTSWNKYQAGRESCSMPSLKSERVLLCKASLTMKSMKWVQLRQLLKASGCLFLPLVLRIFCQSLGFFSPWPRLKRHPVHDTTWRPLIVEKFQFKTLCFISKPKHQNPTSPPTLMLRPPSRVRNFRISRKRRSWQTWPWGASPRQVNYKCICLYSKNINIYYI